MKDIKELFTAFERFAYGQSLHTAFTQLLVWTMLPFRKMIVNRATTRLKTYQTHPKPPQLVQFITLIGDASEGFCDPLGELYQQAILSGHNGQHWT